MRKNKKLLLASVAAMGALALGVGATSTFAWFQASSTATFKNDTDQYTVSVVGSSATAGVVKFAASAGTVTYVENDATPTERTTGSIVLTNSSGKTGYINNGNVVLRDIGEDEAGYGYSQITITATLESGDSLYDAIMYLHGQGYNLYPGADPTTNVRAQIADAKSDAVYSNAKDQTRFGSAVALNTGTGLQPGCSSVTWTYKIFFSVEPVHDANTANGSAAETTVSNATNVVVYDTSNDHNADKVTAGCFIAKTANAPTDGTSELADDYS